MWSKCRPLPIGCHGSNSWIRSPAKPKPSTMLTLVAPTLLIIPLTWVLPAASLWATTLTFSFAIAARTLFLLNSSWSGGWENANVFMATDSVSVPLITLSCWLLPLILLASQQQIENLTDNYQRIYITTLAFLQFFLLLAFSATTMISFYIAFEATLIPTLILITRWGAQKERLISGNYFVLYTLLASLPLLVALLQWYTKESSLSIITLLTANPIESDSLSVKIWWASCLFAFLVKLPLYGLHLWLPKAHVEAPIAGSIILAAVLLKLGGYALLRLALILKPLTIHLSYPFVVFALWGVVITSATCLRQVDLKSLIAYSSVSHIGLVTAAILCQTSWSFTGAIILIIAHGLTSSLLFCLANTNYERTHSRTILLVRGLHIVLPLISTWWLIGSLTNLGLPPALNFIAELVIMTALFNWSWYTILLTGTGILITVAYSLYIFLITQRGPVPKHIINMIPSFTRENLVIVLHVLPLLLLTFKPELVHVTALCRYSSTRTLDCDSESRG